MTIEIPIYNNQNKKARYRLVSMIIGMPFDYEGNDYVHTFPCIITKNKNKKAWNIFDDEKVRSYKSPYKEHLRILKIPNYHYEKLINITSEGANTYFYQFDGFKEHYSASPAENGQVKIEHK